ncbi:MAG: hypothetical protein U0074_02430 [Kouleothrix sp.]
MTESQADHQQKEHYYTSIVEHIVALGEGENFITTWHMSSKAWSSIGCMCWAIFSTAGLPPSG